MSEQHSTGGRVCLGKMSRRGNAYLRGLSLQDAHSIMRRVRLETTDDLSCRI
ncbi:IS110 family transposase [Dyella sp. M7H15-1]|uniref:IS110 family transposase n=1 Tax=Dyella sp. M7H15-1 TaxID=2501295 RepID=UPI0013E8DF28|nr:IS110 family transposase [Dyella sp. M7H15-1]